MSTVHKRTPSLLGDSSSLCTLQNQPSSFPIELDRYFLVEYPNASDSFDLGHRFPLALNRRLRTPAKGVSSKGPCKFASGVAQPLSLNSVLQTPQPPLAFTPVTPKPKQLLHPARHPHGRD
jgi:hypothetical protein